MSTKNQKVKHISEHRQAVLLLEDGTVFYGKSEGVTGIATGEICFNTGMTGYQEIFTDPSYYGQILVSTNVHVGNYGVHEVETESSSIKIAGLVCRSLSSVYSRRSAQASINKYFERDNIVAISGIDTRALVRYVRDKGAMNAIISSEELNIEKLKERMALIPSMAGLELSTSVSTSVPYFAGNEGAKYKVAVLDFGVKANIIRNITDRDCFVQVFPAKTSYKEMKRWNPDGYLLSNGPGDPAAMPYVVGTVSAILEENKPIFGICLGHQILAEACGLGTYKMHIGHRGANHPVKNLLTGKCEITSQNHGFNVSEEGVKKSSKVEVTHVNLNDNTIEGLRVKGKNAFSVQYHPEASPGPHDSRYLFDQFIASMSE